MAARVGVAARGRGGLGWRDELDGSSGSRAASPRLEPSREARRSKLRQGGERPAPDKTQLNGRSHLNETISD